MNVYCFWNTTFRLQGFSSHVTVCVTLCIFSADSGAHSGSSGRGHGLPPLDLSPHLSDEQRNGSAGTRGHGRGKTIRGSPPGERLRVGGPCVARQDFSALG